MEKRNGKNLDFLGT